MSATVSTPSYLDIRLAVVRTATACACGRALTPGDRAGRAESNGQYVCLPCVKQALWAAVESGS